jgi:hypothetical protein
LARACLFASTQFEVAVFVFGRVRAFMPVELVR